MKRMMRSADHPFAPDVVTVLWINFNIQVIDHTAQAHDDEQENKYKIMYRDKQQ